SVCGGTPSRAAYTSLAVARSETGCSTVLIPWVEEPVMITPDVVGLVGIVWLKIVWPKDEREVRKSTARSPRMAISPLAVRFNRAQPAREEGPPGPPPGGSERRPGMRPGRRAGGSSREW